MEKEICTKNIWFLVMSLTLLLLYWVSYCLYVCHSCFKTYYDLSISEMFVCLYCLSLVFFAGLHLWVTLFLEQHLELTSTCFWSSFWSSPPHVLQPSCNLYLLCLALISMLICHNRASKMRDLNYPMDILIYGITISIWLELAPLILGGESLLSNHIWWK